MSNTKFFNDAIAEAKAIRETALANAKLALEEAFTPQIQSMLEKKLAEEEDKLDEVDEMDEAKKDMDEAKDMDEMKDMDEAKDMEEMKDMDEAKDMEEVKDMDEMKDMDETYDMDEADDMEEGSIEEIDLDELLRELEGVSEEKEVSESLLNEVSPDMIEFLQALAGSGALIGGAIAQTEFVEKAKAGKFGSKIKGLVDKLTPSAKTKSEPSKPGFAVEESIVEAEAEDEVGEITVDELKDIIRDVLADVMGGAEEEMDMEVDAEEMGGDEMEMDSEEELELDEKKEVEEVKAELNEAIAVINTLKSELNEVNLLNAKLLYVNKLFRSKTLTEAHKVKVINAFDRAETVKEVKNIYETLKESLSVAAKAPIKESKGFASKAAGVAQKQTIVEGNDFVSRMQKLAGII